MSFWRKATRSSLWQRRCHSRCFRWQSLPMAEESFGCAPFCLSVHPSIYLFLCLSICLSVCLSVCPSIYLAVSLSVCLSGCQFFSDVCITFPCYSFTHLYSPPSCSLSSPPPLFLPIASFQSKSEMIHTAKAIAANGQAIVHFANHIGEQCTDKRYVIIITVQPEILAVN